MGKDILKRVKPISISEKLMFTTVKIETEEGSGTGSFFQFEIEGKVIPIIITNKHVVNNKTTEIVYFKFHVIDENGNPNENIYFKYKTNWIFHDSKDLCFCFAEPLFQYVKELFKKDVFCISNDENLVLTQKELENLSALEDVIMVGYPNGLCDEENNFPIFRKGITANHPAIDFKNKHEFKESGIGVVDIACFPGSSGSPIYILNEGSYPIKGQGLNVGSRLILLGFLCSGPRIIDDEKIEIEEIPTAFKGKFETKTMINLGYYIKSKELDDFKRKIRQILNSAKLS